MLINQIAVFMENKRGMVKSVTDVLSSEGVNLLSVSIADTKDFGILRAITSDNKKATEVLRQKGFMVSNVDLIAVEVEDEPGVLAGILGILDEKGVDIEYLYSYTEPNGKVAVLFRVNNTEETLKIIKENNIKLIEKPIF